MHFSSRFIPKNQLFLTIYEILSWVGLNQFFVFNRETKHHFQWRCAPHVRNTSVRHDTRNLYPFCLIVDPDEIKRLGKRFRKLDLDNSGSLSVDEFMSLPELQQNPLVQRVIDIFDTDGNGEVDFKGMLLIFNKFQ